MEGKCESAMNFYPIYGKAGILSLIQVSIQLTIFFILVGYQLWNAYQVRIGNIFAAKIFVVESYVWILFAFGVSSVFLGGVVAYFQAAPYPSGLETLACAVWLAIAWGQYHFVLDGIAVFLVMNGGGSGSLMKAFKWASIPGIFAGCIVFFSYYGHQLGLSQEGSFWILLSGELCFYCFYIILLLVPIKAFPRRPAVMFYARFWTCCRFIYIITIFLMFYKYDIGFCLYLSFLYIIFGVMKPLIIYYTLRKESSYWQGDFVNEGMSVTPLTASAAPTLRSNSQINLHTPLLGFSFEPSTACEVASQMDTVDSEFLISYESLNLGMTSSPLIQCH